MIARGSEVSYMPICSQWWEQEIKVGKSSRVVLAITCRLCSAVAGQQQQPAPPPPVEAAPAATTPVQPPEPAHAQTPPATSQAPQAQGRGAAPRRGVACKSRRVKPAHRL